MPYDLTRSGADHCFARLASTSGVRKVPHPHISQYLIPKFLTPDQCVGLMERIDAAVRPSTVTDDNGDPEFRTSWTGDLDHSDPFVQSINTMLCDLTGIAAPFGEPLQGQRYEVGQEFKGHTDYFEATGVDYAEHTTVSGQRTWTAMAYLNTVDAGGATRFQHIDKIHKPEGGKLLLWCNLDANGNVNPWTLHHAMKVRKGRKYAITKWFREREWPWG